MSRHAAILPILIPLAAALLQLLAANVLAAQRAIGLAAGLAGMLVSGWLVHMADTGPVLVYALGNWAAPASIVLAVDRLAAAMALLTALLACGALLYAGAGFDARGRHFHPLFQLQLVGLQGTFLTDDLFNLFVFFELMLLASYALLAHGGGLARTRTGIAYATLNIAGSAFFLIALGMLYGSLGTVNLADVALRLQALDDHLALARTACALLVAVFALKAALLPLSFWLPHAYTAAGPPVAALFVIMTKVGIVALLRVQVIAMAPAPATANLLDHWLQPMALATIAFAALGALSAARLRQLAAWLVLGSAGTLLLAPALPQPAMSAAALYYLIQSTCGTAGLPPFAGFIGKLMLLQAVRDSGQAAVIWSVLLVAGLAVIVALAKNGASLFWERNSALPAANGQPIGWRRAAALTLLVSPALLLALAARPISGYATRTAAQLHDPQAYVAAILGTEHPKIERSVRP